MKYVSFVLFQENDFFYTCFVLIIVLKNCQFIQIKYSLYQENEFYLFIILIISFNLLGLFIK